MSERFRFDDDFQPIPSTAIDADPAATMRDLYYRVARLEHSLQEQHVQALADMRGILTELLEMSDGVTTVVERWGVTTKAQDAAVIRGIVALGKNLLSILHRHQVQPVETLGRPFDPETSDVVGKEGRANVPPDTVLREVQIGYRWPDGLLRRAKVIVSTQTAESEPVQGVAAEPDSSV